MNQLRCAGSKGGGIFLKASGSGLRVRNLAYGYTVSRPTSDFIARDSPSNLASLLQANPNFREAGYLMPNRR